MKTVVPQGSVFGPIFILNHTVELQDTRKSLGDFYHCYADDSQNYFTYEGITKAETKLGVFCNKLDQWMRSRQLKPNSDNI